MNNTTTCITDIFILMKNVNEKTNAICAYVLNFDTACLVVMSISWSIYLIIQMIKDRKKYKLKINTQYCRTDWCRDNKMKNYKSNVIKNILLVVVCLSECILCLSSYSYESGRLGHRTHEQSYPHQFNKILDQKSEFLTTKMYTKSLRNPLIMISNMITAISVCSIFLSVNLLTQYLVHTYSYYQREFKLKRRIVISISFLSFQIILGLIKPTILLQYILIFFLIIYQFITLCIATNKLQKLLKQRLKDSITHENQSVSVIRYYQLVYREYRYGSIILLTSLFLQMVGFSIHFIQPVVSEITEVIHLKEMLPLYVHTYDLMISALEEVFLSIGLSMLIISYFIVSIRRLVRYLRKTYKESTTNLGRNSRIQRLLQNNYDAYYRAHY